MSPSSINTQVKAMNISEGDSILSSEAVKAAAAEIIDEIDELDSERIDLQTEIVTVTEIDDEDHQDECDELETMIDNLRLQAEELREENKDLLEFAADLDNWSVVDTSLICEDYFTQYAEEMARDIYGIDTNEWPCNLIDWDEAADQLLSDYTSIEFGTTTYYYRG